MNRLFLFIGLLIVLKSCIVVTTAIWEHSDNFKVKQGIKPSEVIGEYLKIPDDERKKNYYLVFFDIYCEPCYKQIKYCNQLFYRTKHFFQWKAITIYDSISEKRYNSKIKRENIETFDFPTYYEINGLKSSLRNIYFNNNITERDLVPMSFVIIDDSIWFIQNGSINNEDKLLKHEYLLDSLINLYENQNNNSP